jgi:hypothetical protein
MTKQELINRLATKGEIEIHPHPLIPNIKRVLDLYDGILIYPFQKQVWLKFKVYYLDSEGNRITNSNAFKPYERPLFANNEGETLEFDALNELILKGDKMFWELILDTTLFRASEIGGSKFD